MTRLAVVLNELPYDWRMELGRKPEQLVGQSTLAARPLKGEPRQALVVQRNPLVDRCALVGHWRPRAHFQAEVARARRYLRTTSAVMSPPRSLPAEDNHGPSSGEALGGLLAGPGPWPGLAPEKSAGTTAHQPFPSCPQSGAERVADSQQELDLRCLALRVEAPPWSSP